MKKIKKITNIRILIIFIIILIIIALILSNLSKPKTFEEKREKLLIDLYSNIEDAISEGRYRCCIEPPCTMCYLGDWIWEDGSCYCDDLILEGKFDKVCPQCKRGIEEGRCTSTRQEVCKKT